MTTSGPPVYPLAGPVEGRRRPFTCGRGASSNPGGPSGGGGWHSSAGIYYPWQTSAQQGNLGPFLDPQISGSGVTGPILVTNDVWNPIAGWQQTIYAADAAHFLVIANMPANNGAVVSYPSVGITYSNPTNTSLPLYVKDVTLFTSSYDETQPYGPGIASEAGYDNWCNNYANEIMLQTDMVDPSGVRGGFPTIDTQTFGGTNGIPVHTWNLTVSGTEIIWQLADPPVVVTPTSVNGGLRALAVDYRTMLNWLADRGYLKYDLFTSTHTSTGFGWEICSTNGLPQQYRMNGYTSTFTYSPMATSPGLELSGFTISGPGALDTINSVTVSVTEYQSDLAAQPCTIELWDYSSGSGIPVGPAKLGARSTSNANVSQATFYGTLTPASLPDLRVRVYGNAATTLTESVGGVALSVNYDPAPPWQAIQQGRRAVTIPARFG